MAEFRTISDAVAAGYVPCRPRLVEHYRGGEIRIIDTSGRQSFGYAFRIAAYGPDGERLGTFGQSRSVRLTDEVNAIGDRGAIMEMFAPEEYQDAIDAARRAIDKAAGISSDPEEVRLTGWHAIRYAERHDAACNYAERHHPVLCHYATPMEDAGTDITLETAREIAREDASLVYCDVPTESVEAELERVFGRRARVLAARRENTQVEVVVDGWMEPVWYAVGPLMSELAEWADGAGAGEGDAEVCRALEERGAFLERRSDAEARPQATPPA